MSLEQRRQLMTAEAQNYVCELEAFRKEQPKTAENLKDLHTRIGAALDNLMVTVDRNSHLYMDAWDSYEKEGKETLSYIDHRRSIYDIGLLLYDVYKELEKLSVFIAARVEDW